MKGIFEFESGGAKHGFKFGTYAIAVACEQDGDIDVTELFRRCGFGADNSSPRLKSLLHLFYGAAVQYAENKNQPADFKVSDVSEWMDDIGLDRVMEILSKAILPYESKNSESPAETGESSQSTTASKSQ